MSTHLKPHPETVDVPAQLCCNVDAEPLRAKTARSHLREANLCPEHTRRQVACGTSQCAPHSSNAALTLGPRLFRKPSFTSQQGGAGCSQAASGVNHLGDEHDAPLVPVTAVTFEAPRVGVIPGTLD